MTKLISLDDEREKRKEPCVYCGADPHPTVLSCPRIIHIEVSPEYGCVVGIEFRHDWEPPVAG